MSQEKVDKNKELKYNRKKIVKKNRRKHIFNMILTVVIVCGALGAVFGWIGYSAYKNYEENKETVSTAVDLSALADYMSSLTSGSSSDEAADTAE